MNKIMLLVMLGFLAAGCNKPVTCFIDHDKTYVTTYPPLIDDPTTTAGRSNVWPCINCQCLPIAKTN